jgi:hypothetical protein
MSQVFSFRLDENNPREAQALTVIETRVSQGYSLRYMIVEALLDYEEKTIKPENITSALDQIIDLLQEISKKPQYRNTRDCQDIPLSNSFMEAVANTTRPGLKAE